MEKAQKRLLRPQDVQRERGLPKGWLAKMRCAGDGPEFLRIGSRIFYEDAALDRWLATLRRSSTSDTGPAVTGNVTERKRIAAPRNPEIDKARAGELAALMKTMKEADHEIERITGEAPGEAD